MDILAKYKRGTLADALNYVKIPVSVIDTTDEGAEEFNRIIEYVESLNLAQITRTRSNGISTAYPECYKQRYDLRALASMIELTLITIDGCWRIQFRNSLERMKEFAISGKRAFWEFSNICKRYKIDIFDYVCSNGLDVKQEIEPYIRKVLSVLYLDTDLENVHHLDLNASFMSNLVESYPEFRPVAEELHSGRKENPINKGIMTNVIGYFQSTYHFGKWAELSKAAINGNNKLIREYCEKLRSSGRVPIMINTDGIWYAGNIYHDEKEGHGLGEWKHDHVNCKLLIKSPNAYQFIEDGKINTVLSGKTKLDAIKSRDDWEWGDIYQDNVKVITYKLRNNRIIRCEL